MKSMNRRACLALLLAALACNATAETFPSKPITIITPAGPGSVTDAVARIYAQRLTIELGQSVYVQNRPGGGTVLGAQAVLMSPPDGYTIMVTNSAHAINPSVLPKMPYDTLKDFAGVAIVANTPTLVVVTPLLGAKTLPEFLELAKRKPGFINYASAGIGTTSHLAGASFASKAGIQLTHIPYKNPSDILSDLATGRVQATFVTPGFLVAQIKEGKMLALGASTAEDMVDPIPVPSVRKHSGIAWDYVTWYGFFAPAKTPAPVMQMLSRAILKITDDPDLKAKLAAQGLLAYKLGLQEVDAYVALDIKRQQALVQTADAKRD